MKVKSESEVAQSCLTLSDPMDCSLRGSSIHGISQARVLEWGAIAFSISTARQSQSCHVESQVLIFKNNQSALSCVKQVASGNLLYTAGSSVRCSVMI